MKVHTYKNYEEYKQAQLDGIYKHPTVKDNVNYEWVQREDIDFIHTNIIKPHFENLGITPGFGICHGAKLGKENTWFQEKTGISFIGTDISIETNPEMNLINWDFHNVKEEWKDSVDIIYSNSLDHSYDPSHALRQWISCLKETGILVLEHTNCHLESTPTDPFGATEQEYILLLKEVGFSTVMSKPFSSNRKKTFIYSTGAKK